MFESNKLKGHIIYIDHYENLITNISETAFNEYRKGRNFSIIFRKYEIKEISNSYNAVEEGKMLALFSSSGFLEISINKGNAEGLFGLEVNSPIIVEFHD